MPEGINEAGVVSWLKEHVPVLQGEVNFSLIVGGHSNLTFKCEDRPETVMYCAGHHSDMFLRVPMIWGESTRLSMP